MSSEIFLGRFTPGVWITVPHQTLTHTHTHTHTHSAPCRRDTHTHIISTLQETHTHTGAFFPTGGIGGRLGRHSEGGAKNCAQQKSFFSAPFYISNQYFDIKKKSNIRVKLAKNRK